jgi:4-amino-4-deoxy-L-arabinose transferase-like glycosyltransferase
MMRVLSAAGFVGVVVGLGVGLGALVMRAVYFAQAAADPLFSIPLLDEGSYDLMARELLRSGPLYDHQAFWQEPLYPYLVALSYRLFGISVPIAKLWNVGYGVAACVLTWRIGRRLFGPITGLIAGLGLALYGTELFCEGQLLSGCLVLLLHLVVLDRLISVRERGTAVRALGLGIACGLAILAKANGAIVVAAVITLCGSWRHAAIAVVATALTIAPCTIRNYVQSGELVIVSSNGGVNLYLGNNPSFTETTRLRPGPGWDALLARPPAEGETSAAGQSRWFARQTLSFVREHPGDELVLLLRKTRDYFWGAELARNQQADPIRQVSPLFAALYWKHGLAFPAGLLIPLALCGLLWRAAGRRDPAGDGRGRGTTTLLAVLVAAQAASVIPFFVTDRYRLPAVPLFLFLAADLIVSLWRERRLWPVPVALALVVLCNVGIGPMRDRYDADSYFNGAVAYQRGGNCAEAARLYRDALAEDPRHDGAMSGLAMCAWATGRIEEARDWFERALATRRSAALLTHAARFFAAQGDEERARQLREESDRH